jgi:hypothetical protein
MNGAAQKSKDVAVIASGILGAQPENVFVEDISIRFPWLTRYRAYWGQTHEDRRSVVMLMGDSNTPLVTTGEAGLKVLSLILITERGSLPDGLNSMSLAEAVRKLTVSPPGVVGKHALLTSDSPSPDSWFRSEAGPPEQQMQVLRKYCVDPVLQVDSGTGMWRLGFFYFNDKGGVERWRVSGNAHSIAGAEHDLAAPNGTFNWPYE